MVKASDPGQLVGFVVSLLSGTLGVLTDLFFLFTVLLFLAFDTDSTRRSLATLGQRFPDPVTALGSFAAGTRSYMAVSAGFGLVVAVIDGVALQLMGVPGAFVWAVLAFVTNFIPNIGFVIGVIPPALIALLDGGVGLMVAVIVVYSVINFLIQSVIQPRVVGDRVGLSPTLTFLSLVFWTFVSARSARCSPYRSACSPRPCSSRPILARSGRCPSSPASRRQAGPGPDRGSARAGGQGSRGMRRTWTPSRTTVATPA